MAQKDALTQRDKCEWLGCSIQENKERLHNIIENAQAGYFYIDRDGRFCYVNKAWLQMHGYTSPDEIIGKHFSVTQVEADLEKAREYLAQMFNGGTIRSGEFTRRCKDGTIGYHTFSANPVAQGGKVVGIEGFLIDTTERRQMQESLQRRNRELELLNRASQAFNSTLDLDCVLASVMEEASRVLNVIGQSLWLRDPGTEQLVCRQATGSKSDLVYGRRLAPGQGIPGWVAQHGKSVIVPDAQRDFRQCSAFSPTSVDPSTSSRLASLSPRHLLPWPVPFKAIQQQTEKSIHAILAVPLCVKDKIIGVLQALDSKIDSFTAEDVSLMESLAATAAMAIENARLYKQAQQDAEARSTLLREVNHRVKNNLAALVGLLYAEKRYAKIETPADCEVMLQDLICRIQGLAEVHTMLSASEWLPLPLDGLSKKIIDAVLQMLPCDKEVSVSISHSPVQILPKKASSLALIINELATNTLKYALDTRATLQIEVNIVCEPHETKLPHKHNYEDTVLYEFRDDGPGFPDDVLQLKLHNAGLYLIQAIVRDELGGTLQLSNEGGAVIRIWFNRTGTVRVACT